VADFTLPASLRGPAWQTKDACYKLVNTTSKALGQPIWLRDAPFGSTDGRQVNVPLADPEAWLVAGHELSHIVFGSNIEAMHHFTTKLADRIITDFLAKGDRTLSGQTEPLAAFIHHVVNILDDNRVAYWWGQFNPGDYDLLVARWKRIGREQTEGAKKDFFQFMLSCMFGQAPADADADFLAVQPAIEQAYLDCVSSDFTSCMAAAAKLMSKLTKLLGDRFAQKTGAAAQPAGNAPSGAGAVATLLGDPGQQDPAVTQAVALRLMALLGQGDIDLLKSQGHSDTPVEGYVKKKLDAHRFDPAAQAQAAAAMGGSQHLDNPDTQAAAAAAMLQTIADLQSGQSDVPDKDEWLTEDAKAKVQLHDIQDSQLVPRVLTGEELAITSRLHSKFVKIRGKQRTHLDYEGTTVDIQAAVQRRMTKEGPIFRSPRPLPGFKYLLLLDGSGSVVGSLFEQEARAALQLAKALNFPGVEGQVWIYYGGWDSEVVIHRMGHPIRKMPANNDNTILGGSTPSHTAIRVAARELMTKTGFRQLIHLTDGAPTGSGAKTHVRRNIMEAMREGIRVQTLYVGGQISYEDAMFMSHSTKFFSQCPCDSAGQALVSLGEKLFHQYLTGKAR